MPSLSSKVNRQDVSEVKLSTTFVRQVVKALHCVRRDLLNRADPYYQQHVRAAT